MSAISPAVEPFAVSAHQPINNDIYKKQDLAPARKENKWARCKLISKTELGRPALLQLSWPRRQTCKVADASFFSYITLVQQKVPCLVAERSKRQKCIFEVLAAFQMPMQTAPQYWNGKCRPIQPSMQAWEDKYDTICNIKRNTSILSLFKQDARPFRG
eukprot:1155545-Pelagomonas_calceolata.AAC.1